MRNLFLLLNILCFSSFFSNAHAEVRLWQDHAKPSLHKGFDKKGLLIIAGGLASVTATQPMDYENRAAWSSYQKISSSTARIGDVMGMGIPGVLIAVGQLHFDHDNGFAHAEAIVDTFIVTSILKEANQRGRPASGNHHSMPSGHTSTTFASATSLTYAYGWKAAVIAYPLAAFTAATRWTDDAHWLSDTVAGAFIGFFWGRAVSLHHGENSEEKTVMVLPQPMPGGASLTAYFEY